MEELLKKLTDSDLLSETTKKAIEGAFQAQLDEARSQIEADVRKDLAEKNKVSRELLITACEAMIKDGLQKELTEFSIDHKQAKRMSVKAAKAIAEAETAAKKELGRKISVMERMLKDQLTAELKEFHTDQKINRRSTLRAINEVKVRGEKDRQLFVKRGAKILETIVEKQLRAKLTELHDDIVAARENDAGRRIFEAFMVEMRHSFFNEAGETRKLTNRLAKATRALEESRSAAATEKKVLTESLHQERKSRLKLQESGERKKIIEGLLSRLTGSAKVQMKELLESSPTASLRGTFKKFLPSVTSQTPKQTRLDETRKVAAKASKFRTGDRVTESRDSATTREIDEEVAAVARRAGLRVVNT